MKTNWRTWGGRFFAVVVGVFVAGCGGGGKGSPGTGEGGAQASPAGSGGRPKVVVTTTMVADLVERVGGDAIELVALVEPGVDPHLYKLPARSVAQIRKADVVVYSGLHLEARMTEVFDELKANGVPVLAVGDTVDEAKLIEGEDPGGYADPHVWGDVALWAGVIEPVVELLAGVVPEEAAIGVRDRGEAYRVELLELDAWARERLAEVPEDRRVLVTSHDAFNYFGRAYELEVIGLQGISTVDQASLAGMTQMVDLVKERGVKAIFVETSVNDAPIQRVAADAGVAIGGELFSDSTGARGQIEEGNGETYDVGTYTGMIKHNVNTVVGALK